MTKTEDIGRLLGYISKELIGESPEITCVQKELKAQIEGLSCLSERNTLLTLLTQNGTKLNSAILEYLPDFVKRSTTLLGNKGMKRNRRSDAIDLQFVVDYMHDYCRYIFVLNYQNCVHVLICYHFNCT
jgi:hypothetical protein